MKKKQIAVTLGIMCFILTVSISVQIKTVRNTNKVVSQSFKENVLRDEVLVWKERYDNAYKDLQQTETQLENIRKDATQNDSVLTAKQEKIKENNMILGLNDVKGQGIEIIMKDNNLAAETNEFLDPRLVIVHYQDVLEVINILNNAGAEAISVNGHRIITTSALSCEGPVIKVNGQKIGSPVVIKAIGQQGLLYGALDMAGGYVSLMKDNGVIVEYTQKDNIKIDKYNGVINYKYVKNAK